MARAVDEPTAEEFAELGRIAAALTGHPEPAAGLVGGTLARSDRRTRGVLRESDAGWRNLLVQRFVATRPVAEESEPPEPLTDELAVVAARFPALSRFSRAALVLVRLEGLTLAEVGGILERSPAVVQRELATADALLGADPYAVRAALEALSWQSPDADAIQAARRRAERLGARRRGRLRLVAAALALVVVGGAALPAVRAFRPLPARAAGDWSYALSVVPPDGWQIVSHALTPHQESIEIAGEPGRCEVLASLPAAAARDRIEMPRSSQRVWVQGRPVRYGEDDGVSRIFWPYADGGEVSLTCDGMPDARAFTLELAERLEFRPGQGLRVPVVFGTVPDGLHPAYAASDQDQLIIGMITGEDLENPGTYLIVGLFSGVFEDATLTRTRPATVNGAPAELRTSDGFALLCLPRDSNRPLCIGSGDDPGDVDRPDTDSKAAVAAASRRVQTVADRLKIAADLKDRNTWFDLRESFRC